MSGSDPQNDAPEALPVGPGTRVVFSYRLFDAEGELIEAAASADESLEVLFGYGQLAPRLEQALEGAWPGQSRSLTLRPEEAFGRRDPEALIEVERGEVPEDARPGQELLAEREDGSLVGLTVLDVQDDFVVLDTNHPLADQKVRLELQVEDVWPATSEELEEAAHLLAENPVEQVISPGSLLPRRSRD